MKLGRQVAAGAAAGAAGTTALNTATYLDMAIRGRATSRAPQDTVEKLSDRVGVDIPGDDDSRQNRVEGLGPLTGLVAGIGVGATLGAVRSTGWRPGLVASGTLATIGALVASNGPMTALGVTDPRTWSASAWITDVVPHLAYGIVTAAVLQGLDPPPRSSLLDRLHLS